MKKLVYILIVILLISQNKIIAQKNYNSIPLSEHPRPDFKRDNWKNLNGEWKFKFDQKNEGLKSLKVVHLSNQEKIAMSLMVRTY